MAKLKKAPPSDARWNSSNIKRRSTGDSISIHFPHIDIEKSNTEYEASNSETVPCKTPSMRMVNGQ